MKRTKIIKRKFTDNKIKILDFFKEQEAKGGLALLKLDKDYVHTLIRGYTVYFEVKSDRGVQFPFQKEMQSKIENAGGYYFIVRNVFEVIQKVRFFYKQKELEMVC